MAPAPALEQGFQTSSAPAPELAIFLLLFRLRSWPFSFYGSGSFWSKFCWLRSELKFAISY